MEKGGREFKHIVRIAGTDLDGTLKVPYALARIKGVGIRLGWVIARLLGLDPDMRIGYLTEEETRKVEEVLKDPVAYGVKPWLVNRQRDPETGRDMHLIGADLELRMKMDIDLMQKIKCWRGIRHALGLKVRGQKTRTTGRRGMTVGVVKRRKK